MSFSIVTTYWFRLTFPLLLLTLIYTSLESLISFTRSNLGILSNLPYVLFFCCFVLSHAFKQSRIAMCSFAMLVTYWFIQYRLQTPLSEGTTILELSLLAFVLPVALALVFSFKNGELFSKSLLLYLVTLFMLAGWCYLTLDHVATGGFDNINDTFLFVVPNISKIPFILVIYLTIIILIFAICVASMNRIIDVVIYSSALFSSATLVFFHVPFISSMIFSLSGVMLLIYLLSASYELAFKDLLTDIPGRLALESDIRSLGRKFTIAMIDIDHFKSFNDTYGHDIGDDVLRLVASKMKHIGGGAKIYRYGGEEFTVLFKGKLADQSQDHLELLRATIESYDMVLRDLDSRPKDKKVGQKKRNGNKRSDVVNITISIGVCDSSESNNVKAVLKKADEALYKAKKGGRNKICVA